QAASFLRQLPSSLREEAAGALLSIGWEDGPTRKAIDAWTRGLSRAECMRKLTRWAVEAALANDRPSLACQLLQDGHQAWQTKKSSAGENEYAAAQIAAVVLKHSIAAKRPLPEAKALAVKFAKSLPEVERAALLQAFAALLRKEEGDTKADAFLKQ